MRKVAGRPLGQWVRDVIFYALCVVLVPTHIIEALDAGRSGLSRVAHAFLACVLAGALIYSIAASVRRPSAAGDES